MATQSPRVIVLSVKKTADLLKLSPEQVSRLRVMGKLTLAPNGRGIDARSIARLQAALSPRQIRKLAESILDKMEVAEYLGVAPATLCKLQQGPFFRIVPFGKGGLAFKSGIDAWLQTSRGRSLFHPPANWPTIEQVSIRLGVSHNAVWKRRGRKLPRAYPPGKEKLRRDGRINYVEVRRTLYLNPLDVEFVAAQRERRIRGVHRFGKGRIPLERAAALIGRKPGSLLFLKKNRQFPVHTELRRNYAIEQEVLDWRKKHMTKVRIGQKVVWRMKPERIPRELIPKRDVARTYFKSKSQIGYALPRLVKKMKCKRIGRVDCLVRSEVRDAIARNFLKRGGHYCWAPAPRAGELRIDQCQVTTSEMLYLRRRFRLPADIRARWTYVRRAPFERVMGTKFSWNIDHWVEKSSGKKLSTLAGGYLRESRKKERKAKKSR